MHPDISNFSSDISNTEIVYVENFLGSEECSRLIEVTEKYVSAGDAQSELVGYTNDGNVNSKKAPYVFLHMAHEVSHIVADIVERSTSIYESLYGIDPGISYINLGTVNVMGEGIGMEVHADNPPSLAQGIDTPHGMVLYLNDDYQGGEIYYPNLKIAIKPKAGSLVIHPGNVYYSHGVLPVTSGTRYATTAFTKKRLPEPEIK